jgi:hypothetical protein
MIAMNETTGDVTLQQGWNKAYYQFSEPLKVVAIWLMADGDDTQSAFTVSVKNINLQETAGKAVREDNHD